MERAKSRCAYYCLTTGTLISNTFNADSFIALVTASAVTAIPTEAFLAAVTQANAGIAI
jgi:hypothetical protein